MWTAIALVLSAIITAIVGTVTTVETNKQNQQAVEETNEANLQAVRETNAANVEQANIAYRRSLPINQVRNLMDAGVSKPAALASLTGGGTYQMPTLQAGQSQAAQKDYSGISAAFERLGNIPVNVAQNNLVEQQIEAIKNDTAIKEAAERRAEEQHQFDMWQKLYGKDATMSLDALASQIVSDAADRGISLDSIDSIDKLVNTFNLKDNKIWRTMPNMARSQVLEAVRSQAAENRAIQSQNNANQAANDAHKKAIDDLKNSELGRKLTKKQIDKISSDTLKLNMEILDYNDEADARKKEYKLREARATFFNLAQQFDLKVEELRHDFYFDENGEPKLKTLNTLQAKEFWNMVAKTIGLESIGDILRGIFSVATKG